MPVIGYIPFDAGAVSVEARWVKDHFACDVAIADGLPRLNDHLTIGLPPLPIVRDEIDRLLRLDWLIAEGPAAFLWVVVLRHYGFEGGATILPYLNPRRWQDVADAVLYTRFSDFRDRVYLGSTPSARIYRRLGVAGHVGEPYGIDDGRFRPRPAAADVLQRLGIPRGRLLLFAGRAQPDKDLYALLRTALKARILFPDLQIVLATHVVDEAYVATLRRDLGPGSGVHVVERPEDEDLADLYSVANVFATAATSHFETFGRALAEALACGAPAVAPSYDGFAEVLAQPGGTLVGVDVDDSGPRVREDELLRAIYEVLTAPDRVAASQISVAAHRRFGRSRTIELLAHIVTHDRAPSIDLEERADSLTLPAMWEREMQRLSGLPAGVALDRVWNWHGDERGAMAWELSALDGLFVASVRRALCVDRPQLRRRQEPRGAA